MRSGSRLLRNPRASRTLVAGWLIVAVGLAGCGAQGDETASRATATGHVALATHPQKPNAATATVGAGPPGLGATATGSAAQRFSAAAVMFEKARLLLVPTLRRQGRQIGLAMQAGCAHTIGGAGSERAFGVGVQSTLIRESALLIPAYRAFSRTLLAIDAADPVLARAARDTTSVVSFMTHLASENSDPCQLARAWQATGWAREYFRQIDNPPGGSRLQIVTDDADAASQRLTNAGIPDEIAQAFARDLNPMTLN